MGRSNVEAVAIEEMLSITPGDHDTVGPGLIGETARKVDGQPEHVAADEDRRPGGYAAMQGWQRLDGAKPGDEIERISIASSKLWATNITSSPMNFTTRPS